MKVDENLFSIVLVYTKNILLIAKVLQQKEFLKKCTKLCAVAVLLLIENKHQHINHLFELSNWSLQLTEERNNAKVVFRRLQFTPMKIYNLQSFSGFSCEQLS